VTSEARRRTYVRKCKGVVDGYVATVPAFVFSSLTDRSSCGVLSKEILIQRSDTAATVASERRGGLQETVATRVAPSSLCFCFPNSAARSASATLLLALPGLKRRGSAGKLVHGELPGEVGWQVQQVPARGGGGRVLRRGRLAVLRPLMGLQWQWLQTGYCVTPFR
jgi:hypothetical protein